MPRNQTPFALIANTPMAIQMTPITTVAATLPRRLGLVGSILGGYANSLQLIALKTPPPPHLGNLEDSQVDAMGAPAYVHTFTMDGVPLPTTDRVRPWREGREGKVAESVGEALLPPTDMNH